MENYKMWGTDVEIYSLATALDSPIAVYCKSPQSSKYCKT